MRIAHIVTYVSTDGSFGGPVSVARQQCAELASRGHSVDLYAAWDGVPTQSVEDYRVRLFKGFHFGRLSMIFSPLLLATLLFKIRQYDVVHVHLGRDLVTLPSACVAALCGRRLVAQPHGMIIEDKRKAVRAIDFLATRFTLRRASVLALTEAEELQLAAVTHGQITVNRIANGISALKNPRTYDDLATIKQVVFIARLHRRKRVDLFLRVASICAASYPDIKFIVYGPDEGELAAVKQAASAVPGITYGGSLRPIDVPTILRESDVLILPSEGEVFPMTILESIANGTLVITSKDCGMADRLAEFDAALLVSREEAKIAESLIELIESPRRRAQLREGGREALHDWLSIEKVADTLIDTYSNGCQSPVCA